MLRIIEELNFDKDKIEILMPKKFVLTFKDEKRTFQSKKIDNVWQDILSKNKNAFNGELVSIEDFYIKDNIAYFSLIISDFKSYIGTKELRPSSLKEECNFKSFCMPISFGCNLITEDEYFAVAKRDGTVINNNQLSLPPEGYFDYEDMLKNNPVHNSIKRELFEELNISSEHIENVEFLNIGYSKDSKQPQLGFDIFLNLNKKELKEKFIPNDEFNTLKFISTDFFSFKEFCAINNNFTPHNMDRIVAHFAKEKGFY